MRTAYQRPFSIRLGVPCPGVTNDFLLELTASAPNGRSKSETSSEKTGSEGGRG